MRRIAISALVVASSVISTLPALAGTASSTGQSSKNVGTKIEAPYVPGVVLVQFAPGTAAAEKAATRAGVGAVSTEDVSPLAVGLEKFTLAPGRSVESAIGGLQRNPNVEFAEPDYIVESLATSNDPYYTGGNLWGMYGDTTSPANQFGSQAGEAWAAGYTGSKNVYVMLIDEGIQIDHPDLAANIWANPFDPTDGVDNDGNGYVDDTNGWDFFYNDRTVFDTGEDSHGTHVAGTIGGVGGNGAGVAGVNWSVTMISGKFLGPNGGAISDAVKAVDYATNLKIKHGLNIVASSNSWGGGGYSQAMADAINRGGDQGILFVAAAGNASANNDVTGAFPANYECTKSGTRGWDCVVSVASITSTGALSSFSSFGATTVDIGAPGSSINSSLPVNTYGNYSGTSMATPHVSGAVALCASINPALSARQILQSVLWSAAPTTSLAGRVSTGGRLDIGSAVTQCLGPSVSVSGAPSGLTASNPTTTSVSLTWTVGSSANHQGFEIQRSPAGCTSYSTVGWVKAGSSSFVVTNLQPSTSYCFRIRAFNNFAGGTSGPWTSEVTATTADPPPPYTCATATYAWVDPAVVGGSSISLTDDSSASVPLPFTFSFYGKPYKDLTISSNGFIQFGSAVGSTSITNVAIPGAADPNAIVAPWWDDLDPGAGGSVRTSTTGTSPNQRFVISWVGVPHYGVADSAVSFQVILSESDGSVLLQYLDATTSTSATSGARSATVGLENETGAFGTQLSFNTASVTSQTARRCSNLQAGAPSISSASMPAGLVGSAYSQSVVATGGVAPLTFSLVSGAVPAGLTLSPAGLVSGTPTTAGTASFTVRVTDSLGVFSDRAMTLQVLAQLEVSTSLLPATSVGATYSTTLTAIGGTAPYSWSIASGSLPDGLRLLPSGSIGDVATTAGIWNVTVQVTDATGATAQRALTLQVHSQIRVSTTTLPPAQVGVAYPTTTLSATGGAGGNTWSLWSGTLPSGLSLSSSGVISGTPTVASTQSFTVRVTDSAGGFSDQLLTLQVVPLLTITTSSIPAATVGVGYSFTLTASGGVSPYTWSISSGSLPTGLTLAPSTGVISGPASSAGSSSVTFRVTDSLGLTATRALTVTVNTPSLPGAFSKSSPTKGAKLASTTSATLTWAASSGATSYEVCWSFTSGVCSNWVSVGSNRSFTATGLLSRTIYYWQVRARNLGGVTNANSGSWWRFTTG